MKSTILKAFALPLAAFALASAGAVSTTNSVDGRTAVLMQGYIHNPAEDDCDPVQVECAISGGALCESGVFQVFDKNTEGDCTVPLRRTNP